MEQRGGKGCISTFHARGREKMAGKEGEGGKKKGGTRGNSLFLFFFFSSHGGTRAEFKSPTQTRDSFY